MAITIGWRTKLSKDMTFNLLKYVSIIGIGIIAISETGNVIVGLLFILAGVILIFNNDIIRSRMFSFYRSFVYKMKKDLKKAEVKNG